MVTPKALTRISIDNAALISRRFELVYCGCLSTPTEWFIESTAQEQTLLTGGGATFPHPIYARWIAELQKLHPDIEIEYNAIGSGAGIREITAGVFDFGASDGPMDDAQLKEYRGKRGTAILHFPTVLGADVPTYNIPGVTAELKFTPEALAGIFLIGLVVQEQKRAPVPHASFGERFGLLPRVYRRFLLAVGVFGAGAFAHTLLILWAAQRSAPTLGAPGATSAAAALYVLHNIFYAAFSYVGGLLADHFPKNQLLAGGYGLAALMALGIYVLAGRFRLLALAFMLGGVQVAIEETLEDSFLRRVG